jgi:predicted Zn-dependent peptidase
VRVHVAFPVPAGIDDKFAARLVLVEMLGRRPRSWREKLGASYGMYARYEPRVGPGYIDIGGAVDAERGAEALRAVRQGLAELRGGEGFLQDFVRARRAVLEERLADAATSVFLAFALEEMATFDLPTYFADDLASEIARLTPHQVLALMKSELDLSRETIVCEGTRAAIEATFAGAGVASPKIIVAAP